MRHVVLNAHDVRIEVVTEALTMPRVIGELSPVLLRVDQLRQPLQLLSRKTTSSISPRMRGEFVQQLRRRGIDTFAFGISNGPFSQLDRIFGERRALRVPRIEVLPQRLVQLYRELKK